MKSRINWPLVVIISSYFILKLLYIDYVPMWDGWVTSVDWFLKAVSSPFFILNFDNANHPTFAYFLLLAIPQYISFANVYLLHLSITLLSIISILAFYKIVRKIFIDETLKGERIILTSLFAFYPIFVGNSLHFSPDYGVFIFYVLFLYSMFYRKLILSLVTSLILVFSKDAGIVLFTFTVFGFFLKEIFSNKFNKKAIFSLLRNYMVYVVPVALFFLRIYVKIFILKETLFWEGVNPIKETGQANFAASVLERIPYSYFLTIFVINFNWILSIIAFIGFLVLYLRVLEKKRLVIDKINLRYIVLLLFVFSVSAVVLTRYRTFTNLRYFMSLYPLLIVFFYFGINMIIGSLRIRKVVLAMVTVIFIISNFRTIDPLSKAIYSTFNFGRHKMLKMTSITGECCEYGRDQLVYNLQFTQFHYILSKILTDLKPTADTYIVYHPKMSPYVLEKMVRSNFKRSWAGYNAVDVNVYTYDLFYTDNKPKKVYYIDFPNANNPPVWEEYKVFYNSGEEKKYENEGYEMTVRTFYLKEKPQI